MKIIHTADVHLGAKMDSKFPREVSSKRKEEVRNTFRRMVEYAKQAGVEVIILAGDIFDSDNPFQKDREYFYSVVRNNPEIDFIYLRGNHDIVANHTGEHLSNLKLFSNEWTSYTYNNVVLSGIELSANNASSAYSTLSLNEDAINIVILHGQVGDSSGKDRVNLKKLRNKNIDYLALGHIHKPQSDKLDDRADYAYCGCLEGRGFDEPGEHGFILLDIGQKVTHRFIPFAERKIIEAAVDISGIAEAYSASLKVKESVTFEKQNIYRIILVGEIPPEASEMGGDIAKYLSSECFYIDVKDNTSKKIDYHSFDGDTSLKGEFVRYVFENPELSEEEKSEIISYGLKALNGGAIE